MNSTVWHTLTGFIHHLADEGVCHIDQTEKGTVHVSQKERKREREEYVYVGWFIAFIDKEAEIRKEEQVRKAKVRRGRERERMCSEEKKLPSQAEKDDEERQKAVIDAQIQR